MANKNYISAKYAKEIEKELNEQLSYMFYECKAYRNDCKSALIIEIKSQFSERTLLEFKLGLDGFIFWVKSDVAGVVFNRVQQTLFNRGFVYR